MVTDHHTPQPSAIVQRFNFNSRSQKEGETVAAFVAELRRLSEHCEYGATLDDMLRDRIVCGVRDSRVQKRLLAESVLTFQKAFKLVQTAELADKNAEELQKQSSSNVHNLYPNRRSAPPPSHYPCSRCGGKHSAKDCRFRNVDCHKCGKTGHLAKVCRSKPKLTPDARRQKKGRHAHKLQEDLSDGDKSADEYGLYHVNKKRGRIRPLLVTVKAHSANLEMELDTGASASIISEETYRTLWKNEQAPPLRKTDTKLRTYTGEALHLKGVITVDVQYNGQSEPLELIVVAGSGPSLLGRDWLHKLKLDWKGIYKVQATSDQSLQDVLGKHPNLFNEELGKMKSTTASIYIDPAATPVFCRPRTVPYALRAKVEQELQRLERDNVIEPVQFSKWAAPVVPVVKRDGSVRLCGDYKVTVNKVALADSYPLPRIEDMFATLGKGQKFSKLDLAHAYQQIPLDEQSKDLVTINTHKGLYRYNRLPFGVSAAPAIFQRTIEGVLRGIPNMCVYIDDILVTGETEKEHFETLDRVLTRLDQEGMRLKRSKCAFLLSSVEYLGHQITAEGLQPTADKVKAIVNAPPPTSVAQLRSFLGMLNYCGKFLHNLSTLLAPLHQLLQAKQKWSWGPDQEKAFKEAKKQLTSQKLLVHFDPDKALILSCDASPYGVGAVLSHQFLDGSEQPIAFASRTLAPAERKYAQLEKEGLAILFGVKRFHQFLYGRKFTIYSDHKPLEHLFSESRPIPAMASARIQRWAQTLGAYDYLIAYKPGPEHANADSLSRLPFPQAPSTVSIPGETIGLLEMLDGSPVTAAQISTWTDHDPTLSRVRLMVQSGWQEVKDSTYLPYHSRKNELSVQNGCVLWGSRVVVPPAGRTKMLEELHEGHPGICKMKALARSLVWWPGLDGDLENKVKGCEPCQLVRKSPAVAPLHPWEWPAKPWCRVHVDHAGPFMGKLFLVLVDAHSKWLEVVIVSSTSAQVTIKALRKIFATHGIPEMLVSNNGAAFTSAEFKTFVKRNGIRHVTSSPYHPSTNGLAERAVQTFKQALKKNATVDMETALDRFLFRYRITPHSTTGRSPSELLVGRTLRSHLGLVQPHLDTTVRRKQDAQKTNHDQHAKARSFDIGDSVFARDFPTGTKWLPGVISKIKGPLSYVVKLEDERLVRRHVDHIRVRSSSSESPVTSDDLWLPTSTETTPVDTVEPPQAEPLPLRRSARVTQPPDRFMCVPSH